MSDAISRYSPWRTGPTTTAPTAPDERPVASTAVQSPATAGPSGRGKVEEIFPGDREEPSFRPIDKSLLALSEPRRIRDAEHLRHVANQPCLICGRSPAEAHHLRFAQPRAISRKVSDEFTVPLCALHHRDLHARGDEQAWWRDRQIGPLEVAAALWQERRARKPAHTSPAEQNTEARDVETASQA